MRAHEHNIIWQAANWLWRVSLVVLLQGCMSQTDMMSGVIQAQLTGSPAQLQNYYRHRDYRPLWVDRQGPLPQATSLLAALMAAGEEGLDPACYSVQTIQQLWPVKMTSALARLELILTNAFIKYSDDVRNGLLQPDTGDPNWRAYAGRPEALPLLDELLANHNFAVELRTLPPPHQGYRQLREALRRHRHWAKQGGWPEIPAGPGLRRGQRHAQVRLLRARLMGEDSRLEQAKDPTLFDQPLHEAVQDFQQRHGLEAQGLVGAATRRAMNIPVSERIQQLKVNMDRWRWLPRELGDDYIMVNTAAYQLTAYVEQEPHMSMRVITGKPERPSPIVGGKLVQVIINPDWVVPKTIAVKDILPILQTDPDYLSKKKIHIFSSPQADAEEIDPDDIDWTEIDENTFPYTLVQEPGVDNSLGRIKFVFLNDFAVFLHDTPIRELFARNQRAFSSGCIRVENPKELANFLLGEDSGWDDEELEQSISEGYTEKVQMARPIPVYLVYWTAWVDKDQGVNFREDIYKWDQIRGKCT